MWRPSIGYLTASKRASYPQAFEACMSWLTKDAFKLSIAAFAAAKRTIGALVRTT